MKSQGLIGTQQLMICADHVNLFCEDANTIEKSIEILSVATGEFV